MDAINEFFISYGYYGMALAAFLAGTFVPFSSEVVMLALIAATGMDPWITVASATIGNVAGTMFNYYVGRIWTVEQISGWMHIKEKRLQATKEYTQRHGSWIALFTFLPAFGSAIAISLGILRARVFGVLTYSTIGKLIRYVIIAASYLAVR